MRRRCEERYPLSGQGLSPVAVTIAYTCVYAGERLTEIGGTGEEHAAAPERSRCLRKPLHRQRLDVTLAGGIVSHRSDHRSWSMALATRALFPVSPTALKGSVRGGV